VVVAALLLRLDWKLGLVSISFLPVMAVLIGIVHTHMRRIWLNVQEDMGELSTILQESMTGVRVVKAFAAEEHEQSKYEAKSLDVAVDMVRATRLQALNMSLMVFAFLIATGLILWYGGGRVIDGHMTWGELAQFLFYLQVLTLPIRQAGMMVSTFARAMSAGQRLFEVLDMKSPVQQRPGAAVLPKSTGRVRFENVSFAYQKGTNVLEDLSIDANPGEVVALLGAPGSGKSTAVHLIPRFYDVTGGRVTIDGLDVRDCTLESLRRNVGIVQQDVFLFTATLRENIAYGREDATMEEVIEAARVAQMDDFIQSLSDGYETVVGERGSTLSGGQRQRLSIARSIMVRPAVIAFDDSTAAIDAATEQRIRAALRKLTERTATIIVSHRLSSLMHADEILFLDAGSIVERGTHAELMKLGGRYRALYQLQANPSESMDRIADSIVGGAARAAEVARGR
jgi:ATP-binding cassette subfamily B protein